LENKRIVLIDGNSLVYRAFFALPTTLATSSGQITNAVYGFTSMLLKLLRDEKPDVVIVAFDRAAPTFRHEAFADYKAHRERMPDDLAQQFPLVKDVLRVLKIPIFEKDGYEADDVLATLARAAEKQHDEVTIVTGDRDAFQLISPHVRIMTTRKGISDIVVYDRQAVEERYGVGPEKMPDLLGLKGDTSDNIPGVPGVGEKTASKLVKEFGSLEAVYEHIEKVKGKLRENLAEHEEQARLSKQLAILDDKVPIDTDLSGFRLGGWDAEEVRQLFGALQFNTLLDRFFADQKMTAGEKAAGAGEAGARKAGGAGEAGEAFLKIETERLDTTEALESFFAGLPRESALAVEVEGERDKVESFGLFVEGHETAHEVPAKLQPRFAALLSERVRSGQPLHSHDLKAVLLVLEANLRPEPARLFDTSIAAYLLSPADSAYPLQELLQRYTGKAFALSEQGGVPVPVRAAAVAELVAPLAAALEQDALTKVFREVELPLVPVLARMERMGVGVDSDYLSSLSEQIGTEIAQVEKRTYELAGREFNIASPQQVGCVLFDELGLKSGKKTKTGYSTDSSVLSELAKENPVCAEILRWRELTKLKGTYIDALPKLVNPKTGRLHTSFNQTITSTGRLSSSNPNLQNIPVRTELGHKIRDAFVPGRPGDILLVADYSQIELRILAHLSGDEALTEAFRKEYDIHTATAAEVFEVPIGQMTGDLRRRAKAINFGIIYGMSASGLATQLGIGRDEAQQYIDKYFARYPGVREYITKTIAAAYRDGFVTTLLGRRRQIPELRSGNVGVRNFGERTAVNSPIQGSAADIIKLAMERLDGMIIAEALLTRMVLQVHDELIFEVPPIEEEHASEIVRTTMEQAYPLNVPLRVHEAVGNNWGDAK